MHVYDWLRETKDRIHANGLNGAVYSVYLCYVALFLLMTSNYTIGTNIYDRDWDLIVVLDCCRVDAMYTVASEYEFIKNVESTRSIGSSSFEWLTQTFDKKYIDQINQTNYISANPYVERTFMTDDTPPNNSVVPFEPQSYDTAYRSEFDNINMLDESWIDSSTGCVLPSTVTDTAIKSIKQNNSEYNIVHYMQPHEPHIGDEFGLGKDVLRRLKFDEVSSADAWQSYIENLRYVLDEVSILLNNVDANKAYITADHGEAFGEYGFYGHNVASPCPQVRVVPWAEVSAENNDTHSPAIESSTSQTHVDLDDHLESLGYRS